MEPKNETQEVKVINRIQDVKIQNINMPFFALVGLIIKVWLAFIVATIVVALTPAVLFLLASIVVSLFGSVSGAGK